MVVAAILDFSKVKYQSKIVYGTLFLVRVANLVRMCCSDRGMANKLNFKMAPAVLDFVKSQILRQNCFLDISFSLHVKFCVCANLWPLNLT